MHLPRIHNRQLVLRVNELFHDLENIEYDRAHPEISHQEKQRWERLLARYVSAMPYPRTIVDVGAGTGFVGERLLPYMHTADTLICADISAKMLEICEKKLHRESGPTIRTLKMKEELIDLPDESVSMVTMNSVLHHMPDPDTLLHEIVRILKPGGLLLMGHEPNMRFHASTFLGAQVTFLHRLSLRRAIIAVLRRMGIKKESVLQSHDKILQQINQQLLAEGLIPQPLTRNELFLYIDAHSPTAGGMKRRDEGFDPFHLLDTLPTMQLEHVETYNHLLKLSRKNRWLLPYEHLLEIVLPKSGSTFFLIAAKQALSIHTP